MTRIGTPLSATATRVLLCGGGELGKEVVIELQRLGVEVIVADRYDNAPAMQVAHRSHTLSMLDGGALRAMIEGERPDYIVPEIEAIATDTLAGLESEGYNVIPTARAAQLTMNREGIRRLVAEDLGISTSAYRFAANRDEFDQAIAAVGLPCIVKPIMSSSGKGQSTIRKQADIDSAWDYAQQGGRTGAGGLFGFSTPSEIASERIALSVRHPDFNPRRVRLDGKRLAVDLRAVILGARIGAPDLVHDRSARIGIVSERLDGQRRLAGSVGAAVGEHGAVDHAHAVRVVARGE